MDINSRRKEEINNNNNNKKDSWRNHMKMEKKSEQKEIQRTRKQLKKKPSKMKKKKKSTGKKKNTRIKLPFNVVKSIFHEIWGKLDLIEVLSNGREFFFIQLNDEEPYRKLVVCGRWHFGVDWWFLGSVSLTWVRKKNNWLRFQFGPKYIM